MLTSITLYVADSLRSQHQPHRALLRKGSLYGNTANAILLLIDNSSANMKTVTGKDPVPSDKWKQHQP
jgi:hypothetical protein